MQEALAVKEFLETITSILVKPMLAIGPASWSYNNDLDQMHWFFLIAGESDEGFVVHNINSDAAASIVYARAEMIGAAATISPDMIIHLFDDELALVRGCEKLWPCSATTKLRMQVEESSKNAPVWIN